LHALLNFASGRLFPKVEKAKVLARSTYSQIILFFEKIVLTYFYQSNVAGYL
jgi:hypothetical protein